MSEPAVTAITGRVFVYAALATLLVALGLSCSMGFLAFTCMRDAAASRELLEKSKANEALCHDALIDQRARRQQIEGWLLNAAGKKPDAQQAVGGP